MMGLQALGKLFGLSDSIRTRVDTSPSGGGGPGTGGGGGSGPGTSSSGSTPSSGSSTSSSSGVYGPPVTISNPETKEKGPQAAYIPGASGYFNSMKEMKDRGYVDPKNVTPGGNNTATFEAGEKAMAADRYNGDMGSLIRDVFSVTGGGTFRDCSYVGGGSREFSCRFYGEARDPATIPGAPPYHHLVALPNEENTINWATRSLNGPDIPICNGAAKDGGPGQETRFSLAAVDCKTGLKDISKPVRLQIVNSSLNPDDGSAYIDSGTGEIVYEGKAGGAGKYWVAEVYAFTDKGFSSLPFNIYVRNRYAPTCEKPKDTLEAIRSTTSSLIPAKLLCKDTDIDEHEALSNDRLTFEIMKDPHHGSAWVDSSGNLKYQPIPGYKGTDEVQIQATDIFGLKSNVELIPINVVDVRPTCFNTGAHTTKDTTVELRMQCTRFTLESMTFDNPIIYSIAPGKHGTLGTINQDRGTVEYTPEPGFTGVETLTYTGDNNGAKRDAQVSIVVDDR